jgi:hypothetical protein
MPRNADASCFTSMFGDDICRKEQETHYESAPLKKLAGVPLWKRLSSRPPMGLCPTPRDFRRHSSGVRSSKRKKPLTALVVRGLVLGRRTIGLAIPGQGASSQSLTPIHQTGKECDKYYEKRAFPQR